MTYSPPNARFTKAQLDAERHYGIIAGIVVGVLASVSIFFIGNTVIDNHRQSVERDKAVFSSYCIRALDGFTDADENVCYAKTWEKPMLAIRSDKETWR